jgi:hypothetical protein
MVLSTALWLCTAWLLGPAYRQSLLDTATTNLFVVGVGRQNLVGALAKLAPFALAVPAFWRLLHEPRRWLHDSSLAGDALLLGTAGSVVAFVLSFLASCKLGASDNYFFTAGLLLALAAVAAMALLRARGLVLVACVVFTAIQAGILFGVFGALNQSARISEMSRRWQAWRGEAEPRFSSDMRLNLPWLNPASPPFVLAFNYPIERARGRIFEAGGLGGLIEQGYFASLLLPPGCTDQFDGGRLARYARTGKIGGLSLYRRNPRLP